jgi:hypothetical protein
MVRLISVGDAISHHALTKAFEVMVRTLREQRPERSSASIMALARGSTDPPHHPIDGAPSNRKVEIEKEDEDLVREPRLCSVPALVAAILN